VVRAYDRAVVDPELVRRERRRRRQRSAIVLVGIVVVWTIAIAVARGCGERPRTPSSVAISAVV